MVRFLSGTQIFLSHARDMMNSTSLSADKEVTFFFSSFELDKEDDEGIIATEDIPDPTQLEWFKKYRMAQAETMALFRSLTFFLLFLVVLAIVCYGNRDYHQYLMGQEARAILPKTDKVIN